MRRVVEDLLEVDGVGQHDEGRARPDEGYDQASRAAGQAPLEQVADGEVSVRQMRTNSGVYMR